MAVLAATRLVVMTSWIAMFAILTWRHLQLRAPEASRAQPIFAVSRISGWTAHIVRAVRDNRLIRPRADYTGPVYPQRFVPLDQR